MKTIIPPEVIALVNTHIAQLEQTLNSLRELVDAVPAPPRSPYVKGPLRKYATFCDDMGVTRQTVAKWRRKKWLDEPAVEIDGKLYLTGEQMDRFITRAQAGEFGAKKGTRYTKSR